MFGEHKDFKKKAITKPIVANIHGPSINIVSHIFPCSAATVQSTGSRGLLTRHVIAHYQQIFNSISTSTAGECESTLNSRSHGSPTLSHCAPHCWWQLKYSTPPKSLIIALTALALHIVNCTLEGSIFILNRCR
mmetsp:Transcript_1411/g.2293  ORF Transcript_1411/g.2293 Transcript_1411/m.2293 type:complete len:134 (+) Transcript_1411:176-577(+)